MSSYLVISALGADQTGIVDKLTHILFEKNLNIEDSRMSVLGGEFAVMLLVSGDEPSLAAFEQQLPELQSQLGDLMLNAKRTTPRNKTSKVLPYNVDVLALDHPGIVHNLARFFSQRNINIEDLSTRSYAAPHTGSQMFSVHMTIGIPADISINKLRDEFVEHCDNLNLDASLEAKRNS